MVIPCSHFCESNLTTFIDEKLGKFGMDSLLFEIAIS